MGEASTPAEAVIRHVVWDWNGTLYDDAFALIEATIEAFATAGLPPITARRYRELHTQPIDEFYDRLYGERVPSEPRRTLHAAFAEAYRRRIATLRPAPDAWISLDTADQRGISQSLLSMHPHEKLVSLVDHFRMTERFTCVDGRRGDSTGDVKSVYLVQHLRHLGLTGEETLLIGDSVDDARAAISAGARCVLYASGLHTVEALEAEGVPVATSLPEALATGLDTFPHRARPTEYWTTWADIDSPH